MNEQFIESQLKKAVEASGGLCWKLVCPGTTGVPDRICLMNSRSVFVELKAPGKQPRPIQLRRMNQLRQQGFTTLVVDSVDAIQEVLDALSAA
ncbi:VRR-NUC domain-containing protein [Corynebacterium diphtheriae bv. mitis]|uniref:VRR-NUC domain-containing protein n=1 Tax=Corynebacterium diphtheriae TaxID=1717 RepID=UPI0013CB69E9|nr:VRR-NUC domain-containing protein [Corynebacterium diphtheriae]MBG9312236.1 VRR-NUC domain-containing protein [Corynebacterium diphtheriae bv. mitis]CAB0673485.1 VRR-NUC domain-containing protein [Corynebacterium diphtheriae]CAB0713657.1 VRR-NUC domain-containing protein [Corynebacterium diphtheriae]CAB0740227.1 VRR-NUC domain-containing protein [Corynebacterium diphtheriae]CAB0761464.1 VRR-NUC domain-containing protein [Corynebacterium diphtheriae]